MLLEETGVKLSVIRTEILKEESSEHSEDRMFVFQYFLNQEHEAQGLRYIHLVLYEP